MGTSEPPANEPVTQPTPQPQQDGELLNALKELKATILDLPGKMTATLTDDDKTSISQKVYDLFAEGGAFEDPTKEVRTEPETKPEDKPAEPTPKKHGRLAGFASKFAGEQ